MEKIIFRSLQNFFLEDDQENSEILLQLIVKWHSIFEKDFPSIEKNLLILIEKICVEDFRNFLKNEEKIMSFYQISQNSFEEEIIIYSRIIKLSEVFYNIFLLNFPLKDLIIKLKRNNLPNPNDNIALLILLIIAKISKKSIDFAIEIYTISELEKICELEFFDMNRNDLNSLHLQLVQSVEKTLIYIKKSTFKSQKICNILVEFSESDNKIQRKMFEKIYKEIQEFIVKYKNNENVLTLVNNLEKCLGIIKNLVEKSQELCNYIKSAAMFIYVKFNYEKLQAPGKLNAVIKKTLKSLAEVQFVEFNEINVKTLVMLVKILAKKSANPIDKLIKNLFVAIVEKKEQKNFIEEFIEG